MSKYNKAIAGVFIPIGTIALLQLAEKYGLPLDSGAASLLATITVGLLTGLAVYAIRNAPPELIDAIEEAAGIDLDESE